MVTPHERIPYSSAHGKSELSKSIIKLRMLLQNPESSRKEFMPLAKELYDIIVRPMEGVLNERGIETIIWMLDGPLRTLPLSALHDGNRFMLEKFRNVYVTTLSDNRAAKHKPWNGLGMGTTQEHGDLQPLPTVKDELEGIICAGGSVGVLPGKILLDESFTRESMQTSLAEGYKAVHFASHFVLSPVNETLSYLLLGDGSKVRMDELRELPRMFARVDLVAFSACSTGLSTTSNLGREIDGIGYLGEQHGSKAVLATLWHVEDKSTSMLMREFYRLREAGNSKSQSLQVAQLALLKEKLISEEGHDLTHPFFWAPFILIGNAS
jgi:CHAT domain-containing protein